MCVESEQKNNFEFPEIKRLDCLLKQKAEKGESIEGLFIQKNEDCHIGEWADLLYKMIKQAEKTPKDVILPERIATHNLGKCFVYGIDKQHTK